MLYLPYMRRGLQQSLTSSEITSFDCRWQYVSIRKGGAYTVNIRGVWDRVARIAGPWQESR